jgi:hypothetical protein
MEHLAEKVVTLTMDMETLQALLSMLEWWCHVCCCFGPRLTMALMWLSLWWTLPITPTLSNGASSSAV